MYEFKIKKAFFLLYDDHRTTNVSKKRLEFRVEVVDAIAFVNAKAKIYYDVKH